MPVIFGASDSGKAAKIITEKAVGAIIIPKNQNSIATLSYLGQRQVMLHHVATILGCYLDSSIKKRYGRRSNRTFLFATRKRFCLN
ncbi:YIEGIA domain-containing protein [Sporosarcina sp. NPDC096371]|uniref:YIEGIA domain-containing protein n=1 Tax=Sporosarcina sp. NPDC096371 TaxID=3364530 RepID=UPI0037F5CB85